MLYFGYRYLKWSDFIFEIILELFHDESESKDSSEI